MWTGLLGEFDGEDLALDAGLVGGGLSAGGQVDGDPLAGPTKRQAPVQIA